MRMGPPEASSQLLRVCQQLYDEAIPILYGENIILYLCGTTFEQSLSDASLAIKSNIKHVCVQCVNGFTKQSRLLNALTSLKSLNLLYMPILEQRVQFDEQYVKVHYDIPLKTLLRYFCRKSKPIEVGVIVCRISTTSSYEYRALVYSMSHARDHLTTNSSQEPNVKGNALIKFKLSPPGRKSADQNIGVQLVLSVQDKDKDYRELLPKVRRIGRV